MASDVDASCECDPNFAVVCAFLEKFGKRCGLADVDFAELQQMLEDTDRVADELVALFVKLLKKIKTTVKPDKWEKCLVTVCHRFSTQDAWEIERFGFKKAKLSSKVRVLKELLEMQFDHHVKFKNEINRMSAAELRSQPLGRDRSGHAYWFHSDDNYQIRVYREDLDEETWTLIASDRESLVTLIEKLSDGDAKFLSSDSAVNEDSNSLSDKPTVVDTGQQQETSNEAEEAPPTEEGVDEAQDLSMRPEPPKGENDSVDDATEKREANPEEPNVAKKPRVQDPDVAVEGPSPIVGETIVEPVLYVRGEGSGEDCKTGNEDKTVETLDNNKEEKTERDDEGKPLEKKKTTPMFFFGSPVKNNISSITVEFGQNNKVDDDVKKEEVGAGTKKEASGEVKKPVKEEPCVKKIAYVCGPKETIKQKEPQRRSPESTVQTRKSPESAVYTQKSPEDTKDVAKAVKDDDKVLKKELEERAKPEDKPPNEPATVPTSPDDPEPKPPEETEPRPLDKTEPKPSEETEPKPSDETEPKAPDETNATKTSLRSFRNKRTPKDPIPKPARIGRPAAKKEPEATPTATQITPKLTDVPSEDPDAEPQTLSLTALSLDYNESASPPPIPVIPAARKLRKRGRESSPEAHAKGGAGKRMKLKGRRRRRKGWNAKLRRSVEEERRKGASSSEGVDDDDAAGEEEEEAVEEKAEGESAPKGKPGRKKGCKGKHARMLAGLVIPEYLPAAPIRQSRRLAQLKIKESLESRKEKKEKAPKYKESSPAPSRKKPPKDESPPSTPPPGKSATSRKRRKKEKPPVLDDKWTWRSSSESSEAEEEEDEVEEYEEEDVPLVFKSDHEFSPESDIGGSDEDYQPMRRARTARKKPDEGEEEEPEEELPCQKCGKSDHPEWVLLCDKCDNGWHCSCLRPALLHIPEGDWFCPPCQHAELVENLCKKLAEYDKQLKKKDLEDRRKERLAYVGISLNNVLPSREHEHRKTKKKKKALGGSDDDDDEEEDFDDDDEDDEGGRASSASASSSDSDEPIYQLRQRRQARSYKFNEYDELIKSAIRDEMAEVEQEKACQSRGKDMSTIVKAEEEEKKERPEPTDGHVVEEQAASVKEEEEKGGNVAKKEEVATVAEDVAEEEEEVIRAPPKKGKKKTRKMTNLDLSSEDDDERDEDFRGSSSGSDEDDDFDDEEDSDEDSDFIGGKRRRNLRPVRRSTRARVSRFDADFINDDDDDDLPRKKKKKRFSSDSDEESELSDVSWGGGRRKKTKGKKTAKPKKKKKSLLDELSDLETFKKKPRIKYGGLESSDEEYGRRRTRGKRTTYVDTLGSDSEEERKKRNPHRYINSDDENDEDFVANEDEEDEKEESEQEDEDEEERQREKEEEEGRRALVVPKIYIKKPAVVPREKEKVGNGVEEKEAARNEDEEEAPVEGNNNRNGKIETALPVRAPPPESMEKRREPTVAPPQLPPPLPPPPVLHTESLFFTKKPLTSLCRSLETISGGDGNAPNDDSNDELSEPPAVTLPLFEELASRAAATVGNESPKRRKARIKYSPAKGGPGKKTLDEAIAILGSSAKKVPPTGDHPPGPCIEIAAPPQPFSQSGPTPSVITRMLQSSNQRGAQQQQFAGTPATGGPAPGPFPVGSIRPKQFAIMPADDDDDDVVVESGPQATPASGAVYAVGAPPRGLYPSGGAVPPAPPYAPRLPPHQNRQMYNVDAPPPRYPPPPKGGILPPPPPSSYYYLSQQQQDEGGYHHHHHHQEGVAAPPPPPLPPPPAGYVGGGEYASAPAPESQEGGGGGGAEEAGGEFGGLVSYFSSQQEEDLDS